MPLDFDPSGTRPGLPVDCADGSRRTSPKVGVIFWSCSCFGTFLSPHFADMLEKVSGDLEIRIEDDDAVVAEFNPVVVALVTYSKKRATHLSICSKETMDFISGMIGCTIRFPLLTLPGKPPSRQLKRVGKTISSGF
jgi:hypothetical protein